MHINTGACKDKEIQQKARHQLQGLMVICDMASPLHYNRNPLFFAICMLEYMQ